MKINLWFETQGGSSPRQQAAAVSLVFVSLFIRTVAGGRWPICPGPGCWPRNPTCAYQFHCNLFRGRLGLFLRRADLVLNSTPFISNIQIILQVWLCIVKLSGVTRQNGDWWQWQHFSISSQQSQRNSFSTDVCSRTARKNSGILALL